MISRSNIISQIMEKVTGDHLVISTTGMISREVFNHKDRNENFYMIGSMGLASSFALGVAKSNPNKKKHPHKTNSDHLMKLRTH